MQTLTRRDALTLALAGGAALLTQTATAPAKANANESPTLAGAIETFNARAATDAIGKTQPPLTEDEVIAAIRWVNAVRAEPGVTEAEYAALLQVAQTRRLSPGAELEVLTGFEPDNKTVFTAWSVRLRMPHGENGGTYAFPLRERMIGSRLIGPEERMVIQKWEKKWQGGIASFDRLPYAQEREKAAHRDQRNRK